MSTLLHLAQTIATTAHAGQTDKTGADYIAHPARVATRVSHRTPPAETEAAQIVAWLHDVVEDTTVSLEDLATHFPTHITAAVDAITRRAEETPERYYQRVAANHLARIVKLADIDDNTDPARTRQLDEKTRNRLAAKYTHARTQLSGN